MCDECTCEDGEWGEHTCPFAEDVNGDESLCTCCPCCEEQCALDI